MHVTAKEWIKAEAYNMPDDGDRVEFKKFDQKDSSYGVYDQKRKGVIYGVNQDFVHENLIEYFKNRFSEPNNRKVPELRERFQRQLLHPLPLL